ncbi:MAG TPA: SpoIIE family protein phosphatase [Candidatus Krumholzibacteria bacterium]|nr:SpoIIE family protein phosphatase [Candidatus Krumholzibacteria bacterium]
MDDEMDLEQLVRQKFRRNIREGEFNFFFAHSGVEALDTLEREKDIDVVLTDINMPEMDGLTLLSKLSNHNGILKAVVVSAYGDMDNIRTAMNRGAFDFVTKPINLDDFETTILKALREADAIKTAHRVREELVAIQRELNVATDIQLSMLPQVFPAFPDRAQIDVHARMIAAKEVGGDFYDFFAIDDDRIGVVVGDVSGKGVPAALLMAICRTLIRGAALEGDSPHDCMATVNNAISADLAPGMFVTVFYGVLNTKSGELDYCCAGHFAPYVVSTGGVRALESVGGLVVGAVPGWTYQSAKVQLNPGDALFEFTDGVTEATNAANDDFGESKLEACLAGTHSQRAEEIVERVISTVQEFSTGAPQADDITCLVVRYTG